MANEAQVRKAVLALLTRRAPGATICPSEVARRLAKDWRGAMPSVHDAIDAMAAEHMVQLSWKGRALDRRDGPYRIARAQASVTASAQRPADDNDQSNI